MAGMSVATGERVRNPHIKLKKTYNKYDIISMIKYFLSNCWCLDRSTCNDVIVRPVIGKFEVVIFPTKHTKKG